jgi:transcriptional regulator with XRE-family HTH domain
VNDAPPSPTETHETSLGALLRRAREARNLTREAAARALAVPVPVLAALEEERLDVFEALVYLKGHAARYGAFLGCAEDALEAAVAEAVRRYLLARPPPPARTRTPRPRPSRWVYLVSAVVLLLLVGSYLFTLGRRLWRSSPPARPPVVRPFPSSSAPPPLVASLPRPPALLPAPSPLLVLSVHGTSWISVRDLDTNVSLFRGLAPPPHHLRFFHPGRYRIVLGRARNVTVLLDGRPWSPPPLPSGSASERFVIAVGPPTEPSSQKRG